ARDWKVESLNEIPVTKHVAAAVHGRNVRATRLSRKYSIGNRKKRRKLRLKMDFPRRHMRCADPPFGEICAPPQTIVSTGSQISVPSVVSCSIASRRLRESLRDSRIPLRDPEPGSAGVLAGGHSTG